MTAENGTKENVSSGKGCRKGGSKTGRTPWKLVPSFVVASLAARRSPAPVLPDDLGLVLAISCFNSGCRRRPMGGGNGVSPANQRGGNAKTRGGITMGKGRQTKLGSCSPKPGSGVLSARAKRQARLSSLCRLGSRDSPWRRPQTSRRCCTDPRCTSWPLKQTTFI